MWRSVSALQSAKRWLWRLGLGSPMAKVMLKGRL
jgi:hypothetical protein